MCFHLLTWHFGQETLHFGLRKLSPCNSIKVEPSARIDMSKIIKNEKKKKEREMLIGGGEVGWREEI